MKKSVIIVCMAVLLLVPFASAGFFDFMTGKLTSQPTNVSATFLTSQIAPTILLVEAGDVDPSESGQTSVVINFTAKDIEGASDINISSAAITIRSPGAGACTQRTLSNPTCVNTSFDVASQQVNFSCTFNGLWYFYEPGAWTINATVKDTGNQQGENNTKTFTYKQLLALKISPPLVSWPGLNAGEANRTSAENTTINNTGTGTIGYCRFKSQVQAIDLYGETAPSYKITASNFTMSAVTAIEDPGYDACGQYSPAPLQNGTYVNLYTMHYAGNNSAGLGNKTVYYCIKNVPSGLPKQNYTTSTGGAWIIKAIDASL